MNKRAVFLTITGLLLASVYVLFFTDWIRPKEIQIYMRHTRSPRGGASMPIFTLEPQTRLTSLKVISQAELQTNKFPHALWHLVPKEEPVPVKEIVYGYKVKGMKPYVPGTTPEPLQPGVTYKLIIDGSRVHAEKEFVF